LPSVLQQLDLKKYVFMDKIEIKKDLYRTKTNANFSHYCHGSLYYTVQTLGQVYLFPINVVEYYETIDTDEGQKITYKLSNDLGTTTFDAIIKGSSLIRWIEKAILNREFICISGPTEEQIEMKESNSALER
jgi:hypothetical protein